MALEREALDVLETLVREYPKQADYKLSLAQVLGRIELSPGYFERSDEQTLVKPQEIIQRLQYAVAVAEGLVTEHPQVPDYSVVLSNLYLKQARTFMAARDWQRASIAAQKGVAHQRLVIQRFPKATVQQLGLSMLQSELAWILVAQNQYDEAAEIARELVAAQQAKVDANPQDLWQRIVLANLRGNLAWIDAQHGDYDSATKLVEKIITDVDGMRQELADAGGRWRRRGPPLDRFRRQLEVDLQKLQNRQPLGPDAFIGAWRPKNLPGNGTDMSSSGVRAMRLEARPQAAPFRPSGRPLRPPLEE